jgi:hypothetical protein
MMSTPEFVGVHVRRADYMNHMSIVHQGSTTAGPDFFHRAMGWMFATIRKPLIFVIVSDDAEWATEKIISQRADSYLGGARTQCFNFGISAIFFQATVTLTIQDWT